MSSQPTSHHGGSPIPLLILGIACLLFWILASLIQIQTSEAFLAGGGTVSFAPNWSVLSQPVDLFRGTLSAGMAKMVMWGWIIELIYLIFIVGYETAHSSVSAHAKHLAPYFRTGMWGMVILDAYTDFQFSSVQSGFWAQLAFAIVTSFAVMFFGLVGISLIEHGFRSWHH